jgi:hypothetical protein
MIPKMTIQEEADLIIGDVFGDDYGNRGIVIQELCEENGIAYDPDLNSDEINRLIIDNEDDLYMRYTDHRYAMGHVFSNTEN